VREWPAEAAKAAGNKSCGCGGGGLRVLGSGLAATRDWINATGDQGDPWKLTLRKARRKRVRRVFRVAECLALGPRVDRVPGG
jgi:hypothetical protein